MPRAVVLLAATVVAAAGCGGGSDDVTAVARLPSRAECLRVADAAAAVERALAGAAGTGIATHAAVLAAARESAPARVQADLATLEAAIPTLAASVPGEPPAVDQAGTRRAAQSVASWAQSGCSP